MISLKKSLSESKCYYYLKMEVEKSLCDDVTLKGVNRNANE